HNHSYWKGGTYKDRQIADRKLELCLSPQGSQEGLALLANVRVGGSPYIDTHYRWGYGWPFPKFYGELKDYEKNEVDRLTIEHFGLDK
ncbi:hypothetical protein LCGC14_3001070, partial [marine sediment metagenome]